MSSTKYVRQSKKTTYLYIFKLSPNYTYIVKIIQAIILDFFPDVRFQMQFKQVNLLHLERIALSNSRMTKSFKKQLYTCYFKFLALSAILFIFKFYENHFIVIRNIEYLFCEIKRVAFSFFHYNKYFFSKNSILLSDLF